MPMTSPSVARFPRRAVVGTMFALGLLTASLASAQTGGYAGPTTMPTMSVKQVLETGRDDQKALLRGRIISQDGGEDYTFEDETGRITVEIDRDDLPAAKFDANTVVELIGEIERDNNKIEFDVDEVRIR